jgi:hypothetical protein
VARWPAVAGQLGAQQVLAVDPDGDAGVLATAPTTLPLSIEWLPDGRLLVVAGPQGRRLRQEPDGSLVDHATCASSARAATSSSSTAAAGALSNGGTDFHPGQGEAPGVVALVTPDGAVRRVAEGWRSQQDGGHPPDAAT